VHAAATCTPQATLPADIPPNGPLDTGANVIATFNHARQQEGCNVSLSIDPAAYDAATPQMQELMLVNAERQDRALGVLQLDTTLMSQIDLNHSSEMVQYNYFAHPSPINQPGGNNSAFARLTVNPAINGHWDGLGENIAGGGPAGDALYRFMYEDSASNWGHRQNILGYSGGTPGHSTWIGIGIATGGKYGFYSTLDFLDDAKSTTYTPPTTADTQPPTMNPPTIVDANTVQVINVQDDSDGTQAAAVTSVVFYVGSAVDPSGNFLTVVATQDPATPGTWTAPLAATDLTTLHAVAVDGSGNYNDCVGNATSC
ncbi:MAG: CAP domain-containing protein, partial [Ktedonobacterales bacterium]